MREPEAAAIYSGTLNAGEAFEMIATRTAGESTYAGIVRLVTAAQAAKAPFIRLADRYALLFLPFTVAVAGLAWLLSGDPIRALAVVVAATPCPLILAAPVAFIAGVAQAARRGILVKGGGPLEALARTHTVLFDKTGTLTVGGARLLSIEAAPGGESRRSAAARRLARTGLASYRRRRHPGSRSRARPSARHAGAGRGSGGLGTQRNGRRTAREHRLDAAWCLPAAGLPTGRSAASGALPGDRR